MSDIIEDITYNAAGEVIETVVHAADSIEGKARRVAVIDNELLALDDKLERRDEDLWLALKSLGATISPFVQDILEKKAALRVKRAALQ